MSELVVIEIVEDVTAPLLANLFSESGDWQRVLDENALADACTARKVVIVVDGRLTALHLAAMPALDDAKLVKVLPGLMDDKVATNIQDNQFALLDKRDPETGMRPVAVIEKKILNKILERLAELNVNPDMVTSDFALLARPASGAKIVALHDRFVVRNADGSGLAGEKNLVEKLISEPLKAEPVAPSEWQQLLSQSADLTGNFLHSEYAQKNSWMAALVWWKRAAYLALFASALYGTLSFYEASENFSRAEKLYGESEQIFRTSLPDVQRIVNMEAQMRRAVLVRDQEGGGEFFALVAVVVKAIESDTTASLESLRYDQSDGALLLSVSFLSFAETAKFNDVLRREGMRINEGSSCQEGGRIFAEIQVRRQ